MISNVIKLKPVALFIILSLLAHHHCSDSRMVDLEPF